jgi:hypothetical protein
MPTLQLQQGQIGKQVGQNVQAGAGEYAEMLVSELQGRYYEQVYRGNVFFAASGAVATTSGGLTSSSTTPFILYNPFGSNKNLVILEILSSVVLPAQTAGNFQVWLVGCLSPTQVAPANVGALTVYSALLGAGTPAVGKAYSVGTLPTTPVVIRNLGVLQTLSSTTGAVAFSAMFKDEVAGALVVPPGIIIATQTSAAMSLATSMTWVEVPV